MLDNVMSAMQKIKGKIERDYQINVTNPADVANG